MKHKNNKQKSAAKPIILLSLVAIIAAATVFGLMLLLQNKPKDTVADTSINYNPPTTEEIQAGQDIKSANEKGNNQITAGTSIFIVDASQYDQNIEVRSYVNNIVEDDGTCTFTIQKATATITKTTKGFADSSHTTCAPLELPISELPSSGTWTLKISYASDKATASSPAQEVEVTK